MSKKNTKFKLIILAIFCGAAIFFIGPIRKEGGLFLKMLIENYQRGTFSINLSPEELIRKRTLSASQIQFTVPSRWTIMTNHPREGRIYFDPLIPKSTGHLILNVDDGEGRHPFLGLDETKTLDVINRKLSDISSLSQLKSETNFSRKIINGTEWRIYQVTDSTFVGTRQNGIYYAVIDGDLVGIYFFSINDSPAPIMQAAEQLISLFRPIQELS